MEQVLHWNLLTMLPHRDVVRYELVAFGPYEDGSKDVLEFVHTMLGWAIKTGRLRVAVAPMQYWSCHDAKNTTHVYISTCPMPFDKSQRLPVSADSSHA